MLSNRTMARMAKLNSHVSLRRIRYFVCLLSISIVPYSASAQDSPRQSLLNRTMGGKQFWGDVQFYHGWRIQQNVVFKDHYRLLDCDNYRQAKGSLDDCRTALEDIKQSQHLPPMSGKAVILVHGLLGNASHLSEMKKDVEKAGYLAVPFTYPSTQLTISEASEYLTQVMDSLKGVEEFNFVGHSLGGLVIRSYLAEHPNEHVKRVVLVGVPNNGAHLADIGEGRWIWEKIGGPAGQQLVTSPEGFIASLPAPSCEFAIIAGGRGDEKGYNPLIPGDDDGTVAVSSTQLKGNMDFAVVREIHKDLPDNEEVRKQILSFLEKGKLRSE